jgi:hypothetical protein
VPSSDILGMSSAGTGLSICCRIRAARGSGPGCRLTDCYTERLLECETVCDHAKKRRRDQDRCDECNHTNALHGDILEWIAVDMVCNLRTAR